MPHRGKSLRLERFEFAAPTPRGAQLPQAGGGFVIRLDVRDLAVERGGRAVLAGIGFTLSAGEAMALTGANGAGKSTLLRAVAGLVSRSGGTVEWHGDSGEPIAEAAHYFGHLDALKSPLTVEDNLVLWSKVAGAPGLAVIDALEQVGLDHLADMPAAYLSAGQRRRVAFARLLVVRRPLWLLDEPTAALDAEAEATFGALLARHVEAGGLALVATHRPLPVPATTLRLGALPMAGAA